MTLAQVAKEVEAGLIYYNPTTVKIGSFDSYADFQSYFNAHYRPILKKLSENEGLSEKETQVLRFLCDDLLATFPEDEE